jgi:uncharacterized protein YodC (DUF2158 family)
LLFAVLDEENVMPSSFQVGDVVELKSNSPYMTVEKTDGDCVYCVWFSGEQPIRSHFPPDALKKSRKQD